MIHIRNGSLFPIKYLVNTLMSQLLCRQVPHTKNTRDGASKGHRCHSREADCLYRIVYVPTSLLGRKPSWVLREDLEEERERGKGNLLTLRESKY